MSFSVAIALIVLADLALIAGLGYVMSRATRLTPHVSGREQAVEPRIATVAASAVSPTAASTAARRHAAGERATARRGRPASTASVA
jgi:hypothetical protein